jgi:formyltetrahydrofolate deformylase
MSSTTNHYVLTLTCVDGPGIVHAISGAVVAANGNITESQQFASEVISAVMRKYTQESLSFCLYFRH